MLAPLIAAAELQPLEFIWVGVIMCDCCCDCCTAAAWSYGAAV